MLQRTAQSLLIALCCALVVGPQFFLQLGAWGWMVATYSQETSVEQAFRDTFGGERPCQLCKIIEATDEQKTQERSARPQSEDFRLLLPNFAKVKLDFPPHRQASFRRFDASATTVVENVPTPPPRSGRA